VVDQLVLERREQQLRLALDAAQLGTWRWDMATGVTEWDDRMRSIFGVTHFDGSFDAWVRLLHPEDRATVLADVQRALEDRASYEVRHRVIWPDGSVHWIEGRGMVTVDAEGAPTGTIGCSRDVTSRVETERLLADTLQQTQQLSERLQAGLAPENVPDVAGLDLAAVYRAGGDEAEHIGGDWFDVLPQPDGTVVLVIGDVMGRGVDAAATMIRVRSAVRALASVDADAATVVAALDRFAVTEWPEQFITLLYAQVHPAAREVALVSAGHLPAVLVLPDAPDGVLLALPASPPLGLETEARRVRREQLPAGSALLLVTDGLVEHPDVDLDEALRAVGREARHQLAAGATSAQVAEALVAAARPADRGDDMTVLLAHLP
jgi:PAS domain S-box-containing protein